MPGAAPARSAARGCRRQPGRCGVTGFGEWASRHFLHVSQGQVSGDEGELGASSVFIGTSRALNGRAACEADRFTFRYRWYQGWVSAQSGSLAASCRFGGEPPAGVGTARPQGA